MQNAANREPLCDVDWVNGWSIAVFYAVAAWAREFGGSPGWYWWCYPGCLPEGDAFGPFATSFRAYRNALSVA
jgi:hypothetical protein